MDDVDEFLSHFGVKGMHWGVRNDRQSSGETSGSGGSDHAKLKKALIIGGVVVGTAVVAAGVVYAAKHGDIPASKLSSGASSAGKKKIDDLLKSPAEEKELTGIINTAQAGFLSDRMHRRGGSSDVFGELQKAGIVDSNGENVVGHGSYKRYGKNLEKVAVVFEDPENRKDAVGRDVVHQVILPKQHTADVTDFPSAQAKAWSLLKDDYQKFSDYASDKGANNAEARSLGVMD